MTIWIASSTPRKGAGRRAASLTERLLAFSRRQALDPKPTDVNRLIAGIEEMLTRTVGSTVEIAMVGGGAVECRDRRRAAGKRDPQSLHQRPRRHAGWRPGMALLTKPFTLEALSTKVADMLKRR